MNKYYYNFLSILLTSCLGFLGGYYIFNIENEIRTIDVHTKVEPKYISTHDYKNEDLKILIKDDEKETLGLIQITLLNYSRESYNDLNVRFLITPKKGKLFKYVSHYAFGEKGLKELVESKDGFRIEESTYVLSYKLKTLNRNQKQEYGMGLKILYEGDVIGADDINVNVSIDGITTREYEQGHDPSYFRKTTVNTALALLTILILIIVILVVIGWLKSLIFPKHEISERRSYAESIFIAAKQENIHSITSSDNLKKDISKILFRKSYNSWEKEYKFLNMIFRISEPKLKHFKIAKSI